MIKHNSTQYLIHTIHLVMLLIMGCSKTTPQPINPPLISETKVPDQSPLPTPTPQIKPPEGKTCTGDQCVVELTLPPDIRPQTSPPHSLQLPSIPQGCTIQIPGICPYYTQLPLTPFNDNFENASHDRNRCLARAEDFAVWCNFPPGSPVVAIYNDSTNIPVGVRRVLSSTCAVNLPRTCPDHPDLLGGLHGDNYENSASNPQRCSQRARDFAYFCNYNSQDTVTSIFTDSGGHTTSSFYSVFRSGCYRDAGGGVFYSNGEGESCTTCPDQIQNHCGISNEQIPFLESRPVGDHGGNTHQGGCQNCHW